MINQNKVENYWNNVISNPEIDGIYPMGGLGLIEIYYRSYYERLNFLKIISKKQNISILEIGCGSGRWAFLLKNYYQKYVGIDISKISIEKAKQLAIVKNESKCEFYCSSIKEFESSNKFDVIYFSGVTQYIENKELMEDVKKIKDLLNPNGIIIDRSTITLESSTVYLNRTNYFSIYRTENELSELFKELNFKKIDSMNSYLFLRIGKKMAKFINRRKRVINILNRNSSIFFPLMKLFTLGVNLFVPKVFSESEIGRFTHKFQVYEANTN